MLRARGVAVVFATHVPGGDAMPKIRTVVVWTIAALVTVAMEVVGLHRAIALRNERAAESTPPAPAPVAVPETPAMPATPEAPKPDTRIRVLSVQADAVEIEAGGRWHRLPGYPPRRSKNHEPARLTTAVIAPTGDLVAIAGDCYGSSGTDASTPSCVPVFVRLYRAADGSHVRDIRMIWRHGDNDRRRPLAIAFDARAERLAVLVQTSWTDCSYAGEYLEVFAYRVADGARLAHRFLEAEDTGGAHTLSFHDDKVQVVTTRDDRRPRTESVRLRKL
jgi:hypothetical protein